MTRIVRGLIGSRHVPRLSAALIVLAAFVMAIGVRVKSIEYIVVVAAMALILLAATLWGLFMLTTQSVRTLDPHGHDATGGDPLRDFLTRRTEMVEDCRDGLRKRDP
jgi:hypothetical protein